jgi:hypothetical protein
MLVRGRPHPPVASLDKRRGGEEKTTVLANGQSPVFKVVARKHILSFGVNFNHSVS